MYVSPFCFGSGCGSPLLGLRREGSVVRFVIATFIWALGAGGAWLAVQANQMDAERPDARGGVDPELFLFGGFGIGLLVLAL